MTDLMGMLAEDAGAPPLAGPDSALAQISATAMRMVEGERVVAMLEDRLKKAKALLEELATKTLPEQMASVGMTEFKLEDGSRVEIKNVIRGGITEATREAAHGWLKQTGHDDIIKTEVIVQFGKGRLTEAQKLLAEARKYSNDAELKERVHPSTLGAFIKELFEKNEPIPADLFNIYTGQLAKITLPKTKSAKGQ